MFTGLTLLLASQEDTLFQELHQKTKNDNYMVNEPVL